MRNLTTEEMEFVAGGAVSLGDLVIGSGNGILAGNSVSVSHVANGNSIANGSLNHALNGTGIGNFSFND